MMNFRIVFWTVVVSLGGFLFGFDTAVISGTEEAIQELWKLKSFEHGFTVAVALIGTVFGALLGGYPADRYGRTKTLFWIAVLYLVSSIGSALATDWYMFIFFRFLGGLGVGTSSVAAPMYISEIAPASRRGSLVAFFQFNVVLGILVAYISNYFLRDAGEHAWRWMLGVEALPSLLFIVLLLGVPESPRWLALYASKWEEARKILAVIDPKTSERSLQEIKASGNEVAGRAEFWTSPQYRLPILLSVLFALFNQISGINAIIYYAPRIFEMAGLGTGSALLSSAGIGLVNLVFTMLAMTLIDKVGRKRLMYIGSFGLIITLGLVARAFYLENFDNYSVPVYLFLYIAFFALSQGAVIWVFISEIFPNRVRGRGQSLGSFTHWLMASVIAFIFPYIAETFGGGNTFLLFGGMMVLQLVFVWKLMPETKGQSLEQLEKIVAEPQATPAAGSADVAAANQARYIKK